MFFRMTACEPLIVPMFCDANVSVVGETETMPTCPVPFSVTVWVTGDALVVSVKTPVRVPVPNGVKVIGMVQFAPGATEKHETKDGKEKSFPFVPVNVSLAMVRILSPVLPTVMDRGALSVFTVWLGKLSGDGEIVTTGPVAVPFRVNMSGPPTERVYDNCAVRLPRPAGEKLIES